MPKTGILEIDLTTQSDEEQDSPSTDSIIKHAAAGNVRMDPDHSGDLLTAGSGAGILEIE